MSDSATPSGSTLNPALVHARRRSSTAPPPQWMTHEASPKTAFITGASSGLGLALVKAFSESNFKVIASCKEPSESDELSQLLSDNGFPPPVQMIVSEPDSVDRAFKITRELTSCIDVFINNAGILTFNRSPYDPVMEIGVNEMMRVYEVNVVGCLKVTQTFMPLVQASWRHPTIINISSPLGSLELNHGGILAPYRCSKAALNMLTKSFALEMPSVVFLSVSPRQWNYIPAGASDPTDPLQPIKQDRRYSHQLDEGSSLTHAAEPVADDRTTPFLEDAFHIVKLANCARKDISGSFFYPDGEMVPF
ncbi:unnamed protein product [Notodromas monacha]|uniref:Uncharacterized protein n=1 Tax=Notodromas monacha TaxID=399045 RepID=A0A7R9BHN1_9CRUS|nr:unnamed protein product [Notodromas monacha]CAG0914297.1 unnamed protein product [Notodromas monacha]